MEQVEGSKHEIEKKYDQLNNQYQEIAQERLEANRKLREKSLMTSAQRAKLEKILGTLSTIKDIADENIRDI